MNSQKNIIAIGALGGSGTRAIAEILIQAGLYMGDDLNYPNDNLIFTRLFKDPCWFQNSSFEDKEKRINLFFKYMNSGKLNLNDILKLYAASFNNKTFKSNTYFYLRIFKKAIKTQSNKVPWGWKEPNTQIYIEQILSQHKNLKYIHVLRNGLDMAFSENKQQLHNWGWKYGINITGEESYDELCVKQLEYWIETTKQIFNYKRRFSNRILILNHTDFCNNPEQEIDSLLDFCNINPSKSTLNKLYSIPQNKGTNNRYKKEDLSIFSKEQISFVKKEM